MKLIKNISRIIFNDSTETKLTKLYKSCNKYIEKNTIITNKIILMPTTFNLQQAYWEHDGLLAMALRLRGAEIVPTICDQMQGEGCVVYGGEWQNSGEDEFHVLRKSLCDNCDNNSRLMWENSGIKPLPLSSFITNNEKHESKLYFL